jgi:hypothetical protein
VFIRITGGPCEVVFLRLFDYSSYRFVSMSLRGLASGFNFVCCSTYVFVSLGASAFARHVGLF